MYSPTSIFSVFFTFYDFIIEVLRFVFHRKYVSFSPEVHLFFPRVCYYTRSSNLSVISPFNFFI